MKRILLLIVLVSCLPVTAFSQESQDSETRIWTPDLVELWLYLHKKQYNMFTDFLHREDSLNNKQYADLTEKMADWARVSQILFNQYQDNTVPFQLFALDIVDAGSSILDLTSVVTSIFELATAEPVDAFVASMAIDYSIQAGTAIVQFVTLWIKATRGNDTANLRNNLKREEVVDWGTKRIRSLISNGNYLHGKLSAAKQSNLLTY
jgi:hypothetical protein